MDEQAERFTAIFAGLRKTMGAGFKHAHQHGFSTTQFMVLGLLEKTPEGGPWTISSIASAMGLDPATVVRTIDSLEKRGIVERRRDKQDRRQVFVEYTEAGRCARFEMHQQFITRVRAIFRAMSEEGRASLMSGLEEFIRAGQDVAEEPGETTERVEYAERSEKAARESDETTHVSLT
jgi:DNA-binding MarR family transcriptional regulator